MASAFAHAFTAAVIRSGYKNSERNILLAGMACAVFPDADVLSFKFGIAYDSFWGHRGFTHSIVFAILLAALVTILFYKKNYASRNILHLFIFFFLCTVSHGILDALTNGGLGVAFFSPFDITGIFYHGGQ